MGNNLSQTRSKASLELTLPNSLPALRRSSSSTTQSQLSCSTPDEKGGIMQRILSRNTSHPTVTLKENTGDYFSKEHNSSSKYCLQMDDDELDRLTNTHYILKHLYDGNTSALVHQMLSAKDPRAEIPLSMRSLPSSPARSSFSDDSSSVRVLDLACGHGVWAMEMASSYPHAQIYGIDLAGQFPTSIKPSNAHFIQRDLLNPEGLPYPDEYFDYVHMRLTYNCFSLNDVKFVMKEMSRVLKPGGYMEIRDVDPVLQNRGSLTDLLFVDFAQRMFEQNQVDITWTQNIHQLLSTETNLTSLQQKKVVMGFGLPGPLGTSFDACMVDACKSYRRFFIESSQLSPEACDEHLNAVIQECIANQSYVNYYVVLGQKPMLDSMSPLSSFNDHHMIDIVHFSDGYME